MIHVMRHYFALRRAMFDARRRLAGLQPTMICTDQAAYSTHLPLLLGMARLLRVGHVLELGSGRLSTPAFLNRAAFPDLHRLHSFENDPEWLRVVRDLVGSDPRVHLEQVAGKMAAVPRTLPLEEYDLIFIDDSMITEQRASTVSAVAERAPRRPIVVVHDFETREYQEAGRPFRHVYRFQLYLPNTGILWNGDPALARHFERLERCLAPHLRAVAADDVDQWGSILSALSPAETGRAVVKR